MKRHHLPIALGLLLTGCTVTLHAEAHLYVRPRSYVRVTSACPAPRAEADDRYERTSRPDVNAIWVSGHWTWESGWVWASGRWVVPRPGYVWEPPVCVAEGGAFHLYPGYYRGRGEEPLPVYREPGHIRVHRPSEADENLPPRVVVRPGETPPRQTGPDAEARGEQGTANVTVRPRSEAEGQEGTANTTVRPGSEAAGQEGTANTTVRPPSEAQGQEGSANTTVRPPSEAQGQQGTANTNVGTQPPPQDPGPMTCSIRITRVPAGGYVQLQGRNLAGEGVTVMIGGHIAEIRRRSNTGLSVRARHEGEVRVRRGEEVVGCGAITLIRTGR